ncbi:MAG: transcriptional repressor LexA [Desulfobacterales bacterium]|nr:transcriptional repressor LexA [Desulfobacterales bacterium]
MEKRSKAGRKPCTTITEPQKKTLKAISEYIEQMGYPPTVKELGDVLGISHASAHAQVNYMIKNGYLKRDGNKARGLSIVRRPDDANIAELIPIPIVGDVTAGKPILATENFIGEVLVEYKIIRNAPCFALKIKGESMVDAGIKEGDLIIVRQQPLAENGDIVVALIGDEATVKRLYIRDNHIELRPANKQFKSILVNPQDELRILGKVVAIRNMAKSELAHPHLQQNKLNIR